MAIKNGIVEFEKQAPVMKVYKDKMKKNVTFKCVAKSIFIKGCEVLFEKVFFFTEFCIELLSFSDWIAKKINPLEYDNYVLKKITVE